MDSLRKTVAALAALGIVGACGSSVVGSTDTSSPPTVPTSGEARSLLARAPGGVADAKTAAHSVNQLGFDLLRPDLGTSKGNVAISPWSVATALAMTRAGAGGTTAAEMDTVLHVTDPGRFHQAMNALEQELRSRNGSFPGGDETLGLELSPANRVFAQQDTKFEQPFLDELARSYGAGVGLVDYRTATETARRTINTWVDDQTETRIPELLASGALDDMTRLVLVNALYLKADWQFPFQKDATADATFHAPAGDVTVPFMHGNEERRFATGDGWKAVELLYAGGQLAMTVLVPDAGRFDDVSARLDTTVLDALDAADVAGVDLRLPKFDIAAALSLKQPLIDLGMATAFDDRADFSAMTAEEKLEIADVVHQANVTVDEKGTIAAAATAVIARATSAPLRTEALVVDRPFLFFLRDLPTGAVLFAGQVTNPASAN